jgi:hypothetical protein
MVKPLHSFSAEEGKTMQRKDQFGPLAGFLAGCTVGAAAMYFGDPHRGAYRRALVRDKSIHYRKAVARRVSHAGKDAWFRSKGLLARARRRLASQRVADDILLARICSRLGRVIWNPHRLEIKVDGGEVTVSGKVLHREVDLLMDTIYGTPGVRGVADRLDVSKSASAFAHTGESFS